MASPGPHYDAGQLCIAVRSPDAFRPKESFRTLTFETAKSSSGYSSLCLRGADSAKSGILRLKHYDRMADGVLIAARSERFIG